MNSSSNSAIQVVAASLLGKYTPWDYDRLFRCIARISGSPTDGDLQNCAGESSPGPKALQEDAARQLDILRRIDGEWRDIPLTIDLLTKINAISRNLKDSHELFRTVDLVSDFGGRALVASSDIEEQLHILKKLLQKAELASVKSKREHAKLLASLFFEIIRIHPFADGNGRTARFMVQLLARKWGYDYVVIPKYRNDDAWRAALDSAKAGNCNPMTDYIFHRLIPA